MQQHLARAWELVRHDLEAAGLTAPGAEQSDWQHWPGAESASIRYPDGTGIGIWVDSTQPAAEQVAELADQVQDCVVESGEPGASTWPRCPHHPRNHPMAARVVGGVASWVCPRLGVRVADVGALTPVGLPPSS